MNRSFLRPGISFVLAAVLLLPATACAAHKPVLPPVRESQYPTHSILAKYYDFQEAFQEADVVAHIRIGDWLGEDIDRNATLFQAETVDVFKGTLPDTFVYDQFGCSRGTEAGYPLYSYGNEILSFLHKETLDGTEVYLNLGVHTTEFLVIQADSGDYYCDRNMGIGAGLDCPVMDRRYREDVLAKAVEQYPLPLYTYEHALIFDKQTTDQWMHQFAREVIANEG